MKDLVQAYLQSKANAWSPSTLKSEASRLNALLLVLDQSPQAIWEYLLNSQKPYSRVTSYTRIVAFFDWAIDSGRMQGPNLHRKFKEENARLFKHAYTKRIPTETIVQAEERIKQIGDVSIRSHALELLYNGLRYTESLTRDSADFVTGKGGKRRKVFGPRHRQRVGYYALWRALAQVGLKPHDLRKIFATHLYRKGLDQVDLTAVMGWNSFQTAASYIAPSQEEKIKGIINESA